MRILPILGAVIAAIAFAGTPAKAIEGPWCAVISLGTGAIYEDCHYWSFEDCRPNVLAGNRGFCNPNPRWVGPAPAPKHMRSRHHAWQG
jgi:hypothetical protein